MPDFHGQMSPQDGCCPPAIGLGYCPKRRADVRARDLADELVVLDRQQELIHQLNHTARYIWGRCDGQCTVADIAHQLAQAFDLDPETAVHDVAAMVQQLHSLRLLESC